MRPLSPEQIAFLSAALRHTRDARHLCEPGDHRSIEQAWHLAGFGPECARKALLPDAWMHKLLGHEIGSDAEACLRWLLTLDPLSSRYPAHEVVSGAEYWSPESRYCATGGLHAKKADGSTPTLSEQDISSFTAASEAFVEALVCSLWLDGRIAEIA
jgi:hypothetical protein